MTPEQRFIDRIRAAEPALRRLDPENPVTAAVRELEREMANLQPERKTA